jgi:hypothetical protein
MRLALALLLLPVGCAAPIEVGVAASALTNDDAVTRAEEWVTNQLQYCQAAYGQTDYDQACWSMPWEQNDRCYRNSNPAWDAYRSDCSGLVSYAWGLPAPGRTTYGFYPFMSDITSAIPGSQLRAGDAINNSDHVMLFKQWVTAGSRAVFIEEPGCSTTVKHAHEVTVDVTISGSTVTPAGYGASFTAIRYGALTTGPAAPPDPCAGLVDGTYCGGDGLGGDKGTLYVCKGGSVGSATVCAAGCKFNPPGVPDACNPAPPAHDGGTGGGGGGGGSGGGNAGVDGGSSGEAPPPVDSPNGDSASPPSGDTASSPPRAGCSLAGAPSAGAPLWLLAIAVLGTALLRNRRASVRSWILRSSPSRAGR